MALIIRAVYEDGLLRPLDPLDLDEGDVVKLNIEGLGEQEKLRIALSDLVVWPEPYATVAEAQQSEVELSVLQEDLTSQIGFDKSLSQAILDERYEDE